MTETTGDRPTEFATPDDCSDAERYLLLRSERRRVVLEILSNEHGAITLDELAAEIAAREGDLDAGDERDVERLKIALHHNHLPKLADAGALDYDPVAHRIQP